MDMSRWINRQSIGMTKAREILGEEKLRELLAAGVVPIEWETYKANTKRRCDALRKIREIVTSPSFLGLEEE